MFSFSFDLHLRQHGAFLVGVESLANASAPVWLAVSDRHGGNWPAKSRFPVISGWLFFIMCAKGVFLSFLFFLADAV